MTRLWYPGPVREPADESLPDEQPRAHPLFIAALIGVPLVLVVVTGAYLYLNRWSRGGSAEQQAPETVRIGSQASWEKAQAKADLARRQLQKALAALAEAERTAPGKEIPDRAGHIARFEEALATIQAALAACERMMKQYADEQKQRNPGIDEWALEEKVHASRYGERMNQWRLLERDIREQLSRLK